MLTLRNQLHMPSFLARFLVAFKFNFNAATYLSPSTHVLMLILEISLLPGWLIFIVSPSVC